MQKPQKESVISASARQNLCLQYPREFPLSILLSVNFIAGSINPGTLVKRLDHFRLSLNKLRGFRCTVISFQGWS